MNPESLARMTIRQNWRRVKRQKCVITNFFFFLDNYKLTEITVLPATISKSLRDFLPSKTAVVRKHIITSPGLAGKKGATGQINYKSYFAKMLEFCKNYSGAPHSTVEIKPANASENSVCKLQNKTWYKNYYRKFFWQPNLTNFVPVTTKLHNIVMEIRSCII